MTTNLTKPQLKQIIQEAQAAGLAAGEAAVPTPMVVGTPISLFGGDIDPTKPVYHVPESLCGFAWVTVKPGTSRLARVLKEMNLAEPNSYERGVTVWVEEFGQSVTRKEAYARAFARDAGGRGL